MEDKWNKLPAADRALLRQFVAEHGVCCGQGSLTAGQNKALAAAVAASELNTTTAVLNTYLRAIMQGILVID